MDTSGPIGHRQEIVYHADDVGMGHVANAAFVKALA